MQKTLITKSSKDYELLDSGDGEKLERFGSFIVCRPDPQAIWKKIKPESLWKRADARFEKNWTGKKAKEDWIIEFAGLKFKLKLSSFKHVGIFPEQLENWIWIKNSISTLLSGNKNSEPLKVLNLFGYTGAATIAALSAGASVTHVDSSRVAIGWAKENADINNFSNRPVRWILDDARLFLKREIKRGNKYDAIIMDPPSFGRGPKGEVWKIERDFSDLLDLGLRALSPNPKFFLLNGYSAGYSPIAYQNSISGAWPQGELEAGELAIKESDTERLLPCGIYCRIINNEIRK